jgi:hypothetical protein
LGVLTGAAGTAGSTSHKQVQRDALPHPEVLDPSADRCDRPGGFVAWHMWKRRNISQPVLDVQVRSAKATRPSLDQDLVRPDLRPWNIGDAKRLAEPGENGGLHGASRADRDLR